MWIVDNESSHANSLYTEQQSQAIITEPLFPFLDVLFLHPKLSTFIGVQLDLLRLLSFHIAHSQLHAECADKLFAFLTRISVSDDIAVGFLGHIQFNALMPLIRDYVRNAPLARENALRFLNALCEKEDPSTLDLIASCAAKEMREITNEACKFMKHAIEKRQLNERGAFHLCELLSDDSNFKNDVIRDATALLLYVLSGPLNLEQTFHGENATPYDKQFLVLMWQICSNLHCWNEKLSPLDDRHRFLQATFLFFSGERQRHLDPFMENFKWITNELATNFAYSHDHSLMEEVALAKDFILSADEKITRARNPAATLRTFNEMRQPITRQVIIVKPKFVPTLFSGAKYQPAPQPSVQPALQPSPQPAPQPALQQFGSQNAEHTEKQ